MKYTAEEVLARLGFVISDHEPRILTWESGGCRQTSMAECALWDALAECIKADEGAAQADQVGELLAIIHGDGGHYQAEHGLQKAAKDAQEKVIQMMTKIATAEPVAPGESGVIRNVGDSRFESWFSEYVVGQNGAKQQARDAYGAGLAEQAERLAAQPAQSVDIEAIREVIESHINEEKNLRHDPESQNYLYEQADKLEAALPELKP